MYTSLLPESDGCPENFEDTGDRLLARDACTKVAHLPARIRPINEHPGTRKRELESSPNLVPAKRGTSLVAKHVNELCRLCSDATPRSDSDAFDKRKRDGKRTPFGTGTTVPCRETRILSRFLPISMNRAVRAPLTPGFL